MALSHHKHKSQIWLWLSCSEKHTQYLTMALFHDKVQIHNLTRALLQQKNSNLTVAWLHQKTNPTSNYCIVAANTKVPNLTMTLVQPNLKSKTWLWHSCSQTQNPNQMMAVLQQQQIPDLTTSGIVPATTKSQTWIWHCSSKKPAASGIVAATTKSQIWLWHCCSNKNNFRIWLRHYCSHNQYPNLTMTLLQPSQFQYCLWHCCSQTKVLYLIMALLQPLPNSKSDFGIVAAQPHPKFDCVSVAAMPKIQIWLCHCCSPTKIPNLTMSLLKPKTKSQVCLWHSCSQL